VLKKKGIKQGLGVKYFL